ncbi:hypothetical protein BDK51DRAFT_36597 [Blyttiomyces helicus]|uniref:Uncharacterized protein n=1 Tax=Blyttiomyces helicus TaxID=388810 RepID=A0A4P9VY57_9FUNG|nr:hypothetical protein BDK51DRAFT_36597 [Blyttiomyces helicus]|eukprot:RKO83673.1 hypothetical protein BDK51DRAFT_36597 [Blyttiomyces helicus]
MCAKRWVIRRCQLGRLASGSVPLAKSLASSITDGSTWTRADIGCSNCGTPSTSSVFALRRIPEVTSSNPGTTAGGLGDAFARLRGRIFAGLEFIASRMKTVPRVVICSGGWQCAGNNSEHFYGRNEWALRRLVDPHRATTAARIIDGLDRADASFLASNATNLRCGAYHPPGSCDFGGSIITGNEGLALADMARSFFGACVVHHSNPNLMADSANLAAVAIVEASGAGGPPITLTGDRPDEPPPALHRPENRAQRQRGFVGDYGNPGGLAQAPTTRS